MPEVVIIVIVIVIITDRQEEDSSSASYKSAQTSQFLKLHTHTHGLACSQDFLLTFGFDADKHPCFKTSRVFGLTKTHLYIYILPCQRPQASEDHAKKAMADAARLAEELRQEQEHAGHIEKMRRALEAQVCDG